MNKFYGYAISENYYFSLFFLLQLHLISVIYLMTEQTEEILK